MINANQNSNDTSIKLIEIAFRLWAVGMFKGVKAIGNQHPKHLDSNTIEYWRPFFELTDTTSRINGCLAKASLSDDHCDRKGVPLCQQNLPFSEMKQSWLMATDSSSPVSQASSTRQLRSCATVHYTIGCNILPLWQYQICSLYHIFTIVYDG